MSRTSRRVGLGGLVAALAVFGLAVPAWAYFSVPSTAAAAAGRAATLGTPSVTTSGVSASSVTFAVSAPTGGPVPAGYRVARTSPSSVATVCTVAGASGSCTDTAPVAGQTNAYAVYAVLAGSTWESPVPATTSVVVPSADTTAPVTTASTSPAPNGAGWNTSDVVVTLSASDASGVAGTWYTTDGTTPTTSSTPYTGAFGLTSSAAVRFFSKDMVGNTESPKQLDVRIDKVAPVAAVTSPSAGTTVGGSVTVSGTASDSGSGLGSLAVQYRLGSGAWTTISTPTPTNGSWATTWSTAGLADGSYSLQAVATDVAGNTTSSAPVALTLKNTFTVTAPSTATAGTPFTVTASTYPGYTGTHAVSVTGLQSSPSGATPSVPTTAVFTNGTATLTITPVRAGSQSVTVTDSTLASLTGTSGAVNVNAGGAARLAWTSFSAPSQPAPTNCYFTCTAVIGNNTSASGRVSITDTLGNVVNNIGAARSVTVSAPSPAGGTPSGAQSLTIPATGPATSADQWSYSDSGNWTSHSFTASSSGLTSATLTVSKN